MSPDEKTIPARVAADALDISIQGVRRLAVSGSWWIAHEHPGTPHSDTLFLLSDVLAEMDRRIIDHENAALALKRSRRILKGGE